MRKPFQKSKTIRIGFIVISIFIMFDPGKSAAATKVNSSSKSYRKKT
jgi:hypothetical protein